MKSLLIASVLCLLVSAAFADCGSNHPLVGFSGQLSTLEHGVSGRVVVVDNCHIRVENFNYDGLGPATFWWGAASSSNADLRNGREVTTAGRLVSASTNAQVNLTLAEGVTLDTFKNFGLWCKTASSSFGNLNFPTAPQSSANTMFVGYQGVLTTLGFGVAGELEITSSRGFSLQGFHYNGLGTTGLSIVGASSMTNVSVSSPVVVAGGIPNVATMNASFSFMLEGSFSWESLGAIGIVGSGQVLAAVDIAPPFGSIPTMFPSCVTINSNFVLRWKVVGDKLMFAYTSRLENNRWIGFGVSGSEDSTHMIGADPVLAGVWRGAPWYGDFFLSARSQCNFQANVTMVSGVCPDEAYGATANARLVGYQRVGDMRSFVFERKLIPNNLMRNRALNPNATSFFVWAAGEVSPSDLMRPVVLFHGPSRPIGNFAIRLSDVANNCTAFDLPPQTLSAPVSGGGVETIQGQTYFVVTTGPNPNYPNPPAWGLSYHINGKESPVLVVSRGVELTFEVRAGPTHPLYITDSITGGGRPGHALYAGGESASGTAASPFFLKWTPNTATPNLVYYQCFSHERLGWKIMVDGNSTATSAGTAGPRLHSKLAAVFACLVTVLAPLLLI